MNKPTYPTLEEFLAAPLEEVAKVAPATMVYAPGGTRRHAALQGIEPWSAEYVTWAQEQTFRACELIFRHGVRHLLTPAITPGNLREVNRHRQKLLERGDWVMAGDEALDFYKHNDWRVRLLCSAPIPELEPTAVRLRSATLANCAHSLYWTATPEEESPWQELFAVVQQSQAKTRAEAIRALYGEDIPPATLYLAFGKPMVSVDIIPPMLLGQVQCYWSQQPGYRLDEVQLRTILYDYAYLRATWREDKLERATTAVEYRQAWEVAPTLGLGMRLGQFWYPASMASSA